MLLFNDILLSGDFEVQDSGITFASRGFCGMGIDQRHSCFRKAIDYMHGDARFLLLWLSTMYLFVMRNSLRDWPVHRVWS